MGSNKFIVADGIPLRLWLFYGLCFPVWALLLEELVWAQVCAEVVLFPSLAVSLFF